MNADFTKQPLTYYDPTMGQLDFDREKVVRWTISGVVVMAALLAARAMFRRTRRRRR